MNHTLNYIINQVTTKPSNGVAVQNNLTGNWEVSFATLADLKEKGFDTVDALFQDVISKAQNEVTVYLKRRNGSSSEFLKDTQKNKIQVSLKPLDSTNVDVSKNVAPAVVANNTTAATLSQTPITPTATMEAIKPQPQQSFGLLGEMNPMDAIEVYSNHKQYGSVSQELQAAKAELLLLKSENERYKFENYKLESKLEIQGSKRPIVSDQFGQMIMENAPLLFEKLGTKSIGLAGVTEQESFSVIKNTMISMVKNPRFSDDLCQLLIDINNKIVSTPEVVEKIQPLLQ